MFAGLFARLFSQDENDVILAKLIVLERTKEQAYVKSSKNEKSPVYEHLSSCAIYSHIADLFKIDTNNFNRNQFHKSQAKDYTITRKSETI